MAVYINPDNPWDVFFCSQLQWEMGNYMVLDPKETRRLRVQTP